MSRRESDRNPVVTPREVGVEEAIKTPLDTMLVEYALDMLGGENGQDYATKRFRTNWDVQRQGLESAYSKEAVAEVLANHKDPRVRRLTTRFAYKS